MHIAVRERERDRITRENLKIASKIFLTRSYVPTTDELAQDYQNYHVSIFENRARSKTKIASFFNKLKLSPDSS